MQLRATTKFGAVEPLLHLPHGGHTRIRAKVNAASAARFEGGTDPVPARLAGLGRLAGPVYLGGPDDRSHHAGRRLAGGVRRTARRGRAELDSVAGLDLTVECITHRFTPTSKQVLEGWYPRTRLEMDPDARSRKFGKFGAVKSVYPAEAMRELRTWFATALADRLPAARVLYWT